MVLHGMGEQFLPSDIKETSIIDIVSCLLHKNQGNHPNPGLKFLLHDHFTGCNLTELWNLPAGNATDLSDAARYPSCDAGSVGSVVLENTTLNTATVAYYNGTTSGSRACFVCDNSSEYELNSTITEKVCQSNGLWSGTPIVCGMSLH